jgi:cytochrome c553
MMICGRCHGRPLGNGTVVNEEPLNPSNEMPPPGISRQEFLAEYTTRPGPALSSYWSDELHSRSHHQQYTDLLKSPMHRNDRTLTTCSDCHDSHGYAPFEHHLILDPADSLTGLCTNCHQVDLLAHMQEKTGATHQGMATQCIDCHAPKTAKTGAGEYGLLLGMPTNMPSDLSITYFENDISSHLYLGVPRKLHPDVAGEIPAAAMPIPYTNSCGFPCHNASGLPSLPKPGGVDVLIPFLGEPEVGHEEDDYGH